MADGLGVIQNLSHSKEESAKKKKGLSTTETSSVEGGRKEPAIPEAPEENKDGGGVGNAADKEKGETEGDDKEKKKILHGKEKTEDTVSH